ncbi:MAG: type II secretion system protein [Clostridia bacterium]|nr:type II secretion system protein [Clostridia bacterium]
MLKKQKGITLIALVITIIVLLILAGVTIAMVVGDNGILSRSREAKDTTNIKKIQEEVDLEAADLVAEYHSKDNGEVPSKAGDYVAANIVSKFGSGIVTPDASNARIITVEKDGVRTVGTIQDDGSILWDDANSTVAGGGSGSGSGSGEQGGGTTTPTPAPSPSTPAATTTITTTDYGKYVDIGVDINGDSNTTNDFRVFLNDGSNVYLIAADYAPYSMLPYSNGNDTTNGHALNQRGTNYKAYFSNILNDYSGSSDIVSDFSSQLSTYHKWVNNNQTGTYATKNNIKSVAYTLDKTAWNSIYKTTGTNGNSNYVDYVVGGPTLEQFKESFNQIHTTTADQIFYSESGNTGYYVKKGQAPTTENYDTFSTADNNLYFIISISKANGAWLASPTATHEDYVLYAACDGSVYYGNCNGANVGFRPLVSLKSGVSLADSDSDGVYDFN